MEFSEVGALCAVCGAQDFLPFRCKGCKKMLCLIHRSTALHDCATLGIKDATSIDCVVCGKSIVYDKAMGVDEVWEHHFATECTKKPEKKVEKEVCPVQSCRNILGPSNTYKCSKCRTTLCLSHRNPSDHNCVDPAMAKRAMFLDQVSRSGQNQGKKAKTAKATPDPGNSNTLMGSGMRQGKPTPPVEAHSCPFCMQNLPDVASLQHHVDSQHGEGGPAPARAVGLPHTHRAPVPDPASASASASARDGGEQCPQCSRRFAGPVQLVEHFERAHGMGGKKSDKCSMS